MLPPALAEVTVAVSQSRGGLWELRDRALRES